MSYQNEFPKDYHPSNTEASAVEAAGMSDESWHNDVCPSFTMTDTAGGLWTLWIDCLNPDWREMGDRFTMTYHQDPEDSCCEPTGVAYAGETLADALATLPKSIASVTDKAMAAFWAAVAAEYPEVTTGDLDPQTAAEFRSYADTAVTQWVLTNPNDQPNI